MFIAITEQRMRETENTLTFGNDNVGSSALHQMVRVRVRATAHMIGMRQIGSLFLSACLFFIGKGLMLKDALH